MTQVRVPALGCDYGWEKTDGCPAVFVGARPEYAVAEVRDSAAAHGWARGEDKFGAKDYCPAHAPRCGVVLPPMPEEMRRAAVDHERAGFPPGPRDDPAELRQRLEVAAK